MIDSLKPGVPVEKDHTKLPAMTLPERSLAPATVAVYVRAGVKSLPGVSVAIFLEESYVTVAETTSLLESLSTKETEEGWTASLKVMETGELTLCPIALVAGVTCKTVGGCGPLWA